MLYCSTQRAGAYGETIARFRPDTRLLARAREIDDESELNPALLNPSVPVDWRDSWRLGYLRLSGESRFVDIHHGQTISLLREELAALLEEFQLPDLDRSHIASANRRLTQEFARYIYEHEDGDDRPRFAGIRYSSRLNEQWELWAIFHDRMEIVEKR